MTDTHRISSYFFLSFFNGVICHEKLHHKEDSYNNNVKIGHKTTIMLCSGNHLAAVDLLAFINPRNWHFYALCSNSKILLLVCIT